jgi:myosin heavy subunit
MGKSKVFIRGSSYEALEMLRNKKIVHAVTKIQATFRMFVQRIEYEISIYAVKLIQKFIRQIGAYRRMKLLRKYNALTVIQRSFRCFRARSQLKAAKQISIWLQSAGELLLGSTAHSCFLTRRHPSYKKYGGDTAKPATVPSGA